MDCVPLRSSLSGPCFLGCLISPRHLLSCHHATTGGVISFVNGETATIVKSVQVGRQDLQLYALDKEVSIAPAPIARAEVYGVSPAVYKAYMCQTLNQNKVVIPIKIKKLTGVSVVFNKTTPLIRPGDSGSSIFLFNKGRWELFSHFTGAGNGPKIGLFTPMINKAMRES
jgi:hypothetical protein